MRHPGFDYKHPDYTAILTERSLRLIALRKDRSQLPYLRSHYRANPADFIEDWGVTIDPRNADLNLPVAVPFLLFDKQREWIDFLMAKWAAREPGITEKSRDMGLSWLSVATAATLCMFREDLVIGFGSRKEEYVDKIGAPKSLFWKARQFIAACPSEFTGGWTSKRDTAHMRLSFPLTNSTITGEAGDNIGRGDRAAIYFVDEAAYLERPENVEASLSQTTNCRQDISSANGLANPFAEKRFGGKIDVFTFHWRDDPRKDDAWYAKQVAELDEVTVAQEIDINYSASVTGVVIPSAWAQACIDAHIKLGVAPTGLRRGAFDVADEGKDKNALTAGQGVVIDHIEEWSGKGSDIFASTQYVFGQCDEMLIAELKFDSDGVGADVRGSARVLNEQRELAGKRTIDVQPFRGSNEVYEKQGEDVPGRKNEDYFLNRKAQSWWGLRRRVYATYRAVVFGDAFDPEFIVSFDSKIPLVTKAVLELSQPTYKRNDTGKIVIDKAPDGTKSPNMGDSIMIYFGRAKGKGMVISDDALGDI